LNEDYCRYDEDVPSIAKYIDGVRFISRKKLLANREDTNVQIAKRNGTIVANDGIPQIDEVIAIPKSPSIAMAQAKENDKHNDKGGCRLKVQINVGNTSVESIGILVSKNSGDSSIENDKSYKVGKNVDPRLKGSGSLILVCNGESKKQLV